MRISARGWRRDSGAKAICDFEIADAKKPTSSTYTADVPYVSLTSGGDVELKIGPQTVSLGGEYQIIIRFTKDDIARMFLEIHPDLQSTFGPILRFRPRA